MQETGNAIRSVSLDYKVGLKCSRWEARGRRWGLGWGKLAGDKTREVSMASNHARPYNPWVFPTLTWLGHVTSFVWANGMVAKA